MRGAGRVRGRPGRGPRYRDLGPAAGPCAPAPPGAGAAGTAALAAGLAAAGTTVSVITCDAACRSQLAGLVSWTGTAGPALCAVLHAAGAVDDGVLDGLDPARLAAVAAAKAGG